MASTNEKNHEHHLSALFTRLELCGLVSSPEKSTFGVKGGLYHISRKLYIFFVTSHNFFSLSSVQIIIIPACCLLCVL